MVEMLESPRCIQQPADPSDQIHMIAGYGPIQAAPGAILQDHDSVLYLLVDVREALLEVDHVIMRQFLMQSELDTSRGTSFTRRSEFDGVFRSILRIQAEPSFLETAEYTLRLALEWMRVILSYSYIRLYLLQHYRDDR